MITVYVTIGLQHWGLLSYVSIEAKGFGRTLFESSKEEYHTTLRVYLQRVEL